MSDHHPLAGATGRFPRGHSEPDDQGELQIAIAADREAGLVRLEFGKPVAWLAATPDEIRQIALQLLRKASQVDGKILEVRTS